MIRSEMRGARSFMVMSVSSSPIRLIVAPQFYRSETADGHLFFSLFVNTART
jgi:hypothetical protein